MPCCLCSTECRIRTEPTRVTVLDFTSMYPTVTMLMNLWPFIIAGSVEPEIVTEEIRKLLARVDLPYLQNPNNWKTFTVLVKIKPEGDVLPVRMDYKGNGESFNVGINHLTSDTPLWYALSDVISFFTLIPAHETDIIIQWMFIRNIITTVDRLTNFRKLKVGHHSRYPPFFRQQFAREGKKGGPLE